MNRDELAAMVLAEVARQCDAIRNRPKPPAWKTWEALPDDDREYGPRYSPTWFGDVTATEAGRVRLLRAVYRLADAGLLTIVKSEGGIPDADLAALVAPWPTLPDHIRAAIRALVGTVANLK